MVGSEFVRAVERACEWHGEQARKGTKIPYVAHLLAVASLVLEVGGDEEQAIAALLHDAIEDAGVTEARLEQEFGPRVAGIVAECTEGTPDTKRDASTWRPRKEAYIEKLRTTDNQEALLVSCADKLHNARSILRDLIQEKGAVWDRFHQTDPGQQLWYYRALADVFGERLDRPVWLPDELRRTVDRVAAFVPGEEPTRVG
jgi:GTP pyrophosphokinase